MKETVVWTGGSGTKYTYHVYSLPRSFNTGQNGNYIFAKKTATGWDAVYIGEGDLGERISENHHKWDCIKEKGAGHVHVHLNTDEQARKSEESDLLDGNPEAYEPIGCNEKEGG